jgi:hypothetical protein
MMFAAAALVASCGGSSSSVVAQHTGGGILQRQSGGRTEHITSWTMVGGPDYNAPNGDYSVIAPYVDYAMTGQGPANSLLIDELNSAGVKSVYYTDPNRQKVNGPEYTTDETTFAHDCSNNRILITKVNFLFYLMDPSSTNLSKLWDDEGNRVIQQWHGSPSYFFDDTADHFNYVSSMPCNFTQSVSSAFRLLSHLTRRRRAA